MMNKFEKGSAKLNIIGHLYERLESDKARRLEWAAEDGISENTKESYEYDAEVFEEVMNLLEKTYLK